MGLNDSYDHVKKQVLVMDPLPSINKVYSMVLRVEKQRKIHISLSDSVVYNAMMAKSKNFRNFGGGKGNMKRKLTKRTWIPL